MRGLALEEVGLRIAGRTLVEGLDLVIRPGEITTLMGPSGCGKSSLLDLISGTLDPAFAWRGRITLDGEPVTGLPPERRRVGILYQDDLLFPHMTVAENLTFALPRSVRGRKERRRRAEEALNEADLQGFGGRDPSTLSGGQRARVALLRTLLAEPRALLLDEPFARLDTDLRARVRRFVFEHAAASDLPTLLVTHDAADAAAAGGPILEFSTIGKSSTLLQQHNTWRRTA